MRLKLITLAQITVTTSGTEVQVSSSSVYAQSVIISCPAANTGSIYVGDSNVSTTRGIEVPKGTTLILTPPEVTKQGELDLADLYIDAATNGDKANVSYIKANI